MENKIMMYERMLLSIVAEIYKVGILNQFTEYCEIFTHMSIIYDSY